LSAILKAIRGMKDIPPSETAYWQEIEKVARELLTSYGYQEIRMPIVEKTELFARSIGDVTDIVAKEMYTFEDRNGDSLTMRPEGTASCVRAGIESGLLHNQIQRLWYQGPMFRHERPQKERYRQFHQIGVEAFGMAGPDIDAELILLTARLWQQLGLTDIELQINSLGDIESRNKHKKILLQYLAEHKGLLDEDSLVRLETNPLRILDSKNPAMQSLINDAPRLYDYLDDESLEHFETLKSILDTADVKYVINHRLVRGLDYYGKTVFEWVSNSLGAQGTVCAGGRYDGLVSQLGGKAMPAAGFAMGLERLLALVKDNLQGAIKPHAYLILVGESALIPGMILAESLRNDVPGLRLITNCGGGSVKNQFKKADKAGAELALVIGETELEKNVVGLKYLQANSLRANSLQTNNVQANNITTNKAQLDVTRQELKNILIEYTL